MQQITQRTPTDNWSYCNLNLKCPAYWNHDKCVTLQRGNQCQKKKEAF